MVRQLLWRHLIKAMSIVRLLLQSGAHKNVATNTGVTAPLLASQSGHLEVVRLLLLESGAMKSGATVVIMAFPIGYK